MRHFLMTMATLFISLASANAQTGNVTDRDIIGAWTLEWMQYDGEKKIVCGKANGYTQFKYYGPDGEFAAAGIALTQDSHTTRVWHIQPKKRMVYGDGTTCQKRWRSAD